jgi:heptosyltransferase-2
MEDLGGVVLTTPVVRCLKQQLQLSELHYLTHSKLTTVIETNPYIDKIHSWYPGSDCIEELKKEQFDYIIDLQHNRQSKRFKNALKVSSFGYDKLNFQSFIFTKLKWNVMPKHLHLVDRFFAALEKLGVQNDGKGLDYFIPKEHEVTEKDIPASHHLGYIAFAIGASHFTKKLPVYKLQELCKAIDHPIILLGEEKEVQEGEEIASIDPVKVYNACGKFSLHETADLIHKAKLLVSHDNGWMHIAAALKKPVITVWGSTTASFGMVPYYGENYLAHHAQPYDDVQVHKLWCRPCTKVGRKKCPQGHFKCMKKLSIEEIVRKVNKRLSLHSPIGHVGFR